MIFFISNLYISFKKIEIGLRGIFVVTDAKKKSCFGGVTFEIKNSETSSGEWVKLKLKTQSKGYAVKILRKTPLCNNENEIPPEQEDVSEQKEEEEDS